MKENITNYLINKSIETVNLKKKNYMNAIDKYVKDNHNYNCSDNTYNTLK